MIQNTSGNLPKKANMLSVRLSGELFTAVTSLATAEDRAPSDMVRRLLRIGLHGVQQSPLKSTIGALGTDVIQLHRAQPCRMPEPLTVGFGSDIASPGPDMTVVEALPPGDCGDPFETKPEGTK